MGYSTLETAKKAMNQQSTDIKIVMGDFNSKVGSETSENIGPFRIGEENERGDRLFEFFKEHNFIVMNTWLRNHQRSWT